LYKLINGFEKGYKNEIRFKIQLWYSYRLPEFVDRWKSDPHAAYEFIDLEIRNSELVVPGLRFF
jgi:hypothetical protein